MENKCHVYPEECEVVNEPHKHCASGDCAEIYELELDFYPGYCTAYCYYQAGG